MPFANIKTVKKCAFCTHWYDPANSHISPKAAQIGLWNFEERASCFCEIKRRETLGNAFCQEYQCKL